MKKYLLIAAIILLWTAVAEAADVTLAWDASSSPEVTGYTVHYGNVSGLSGTYQYAKNMGKVLQYTIVGLPAGTWYFAVTAYTPNAKSGYSNEVSTTISEYPLPDSPHIQISAPAPPGQLQKL